VFLVRHPLIETSFRQRRRSTDGGIQEIQLRKGNVTLYCIKGGETTAYLQGRPYPQKFPHGISQFLGKIYDGQRHHIVRQKAREDDGRKSQKEENLAMKAG
jgi:hypothetical protein